MSPPYLTAILREGGGRLKKTYWPPVVLYTGSFEPNHATGLLHETVDFKKPAGLHSRAGKTQNNYGRKQHNSSHLSA